MDEEEPHKTLNLVSNANTTVIQLHQQMLKVNRNYDHYYICHPPCAIDYYLNACLQK